MAVITSSTFSTAANNIVSLGTRSKGTLPKVQREFQDFSRFLDIKKTEIEKIELPSQKKIKELSNLNIVSTFGSAGNLLTNLFSGALDIGNFISGFFPGKGEKIGKGPSPTKLQPKPQMRGGKLRLGGLRALGITNAIFSGLDFATGLVEGESVGKAGSGAVGSLVGGVGGALAGSLLAGAIGQALIPVPGLGFVLGALGGAAGSFLGGFGADRAYETVIGDTEQKQKEKLKQQEAKQKASAKKVTGGGEDFKEVLNRFNQSVIKFEDFVINFGNIMGVDQSNLYNEPAEYPDFPETPSEEVYDGPVDGDTFFPLPGGDVGTRGKISPGQAFGAPRDGGDRSHAGLDMTHHKGALDAPVVAYKTGKVIWASGRGSYNSGVMIDHGNGLKTKYFHITPLVKTGDIVYGGQQIAKLFPAGKSTHLHFEVHKGGTPINPLNAGVGPGGSATRLPAPLSIDNAKQNSNTGSTKADNQTRSSGIELYPPGTQQQSQSQAKPQQQTSAIPTPATLQRAQLMQLPQSVMAAPPKESPKIQSYPVYSQGQSYILERETIIAAGSQSRGSNKPVVIPVGGGSGSSVTIVAETGVQVLNSLMKGILLTSLSAS